MYHNFIGIRRKKKQDLKKRKYLMSHNFSCIGPKITGFFLFFLKKKEKVFDDETI